MPKRKAAARAGASKARRAASAKDLSWLLGSETSVEKFQKTIFERKHLHITGREGHYQDFSDLSTPEALFALLDKGVVPTYRLNMFRCRDGSVKENAPPPETAAEVRKLFSEGWSIQWLQPQQEHDGLASFVAKLESEFGSLVGVNAYLTPPGVQGLAPHWDDVEVFVMQLGGEKAWTLHKSSSAVDGTSLPRFSSGDLPLDSLSPALAEVKMRPGDLLYFPRGTIHYAPNRMKKVSSVHLTVSTYQRQALYDLTQKSFEEAMAEAWDSDEAMRRGLPWGALRPGAECSSLSKAVAAALRRAAEAVESSGHVEAALQELGQEFVKHRMPPSLPSKPAQVRPDSQLSIPDASLFSLAEDEEEAVLVHCLNNSRRKHMMNHPGEEEEEEDDAVELSAEAAQVLKELTQLSKPASLASLLLKAKIHESKWPEVAEMLAPLVGLGLLRVGA